MSSDAVQEAIDAAIAGGEVGVQVAAYLDGELVVDAYAGIADETTGRAVDGDTLFCPFSVTKALVATALHVQAERGQVDYEAPIVRYWPEYGANGKERTTVRDALTHRAGVPQMPVGVTPELMADWDWMVEQIAAFTPMYEPGTTNCYHGLSWGWIIGEIVQRADPEGRSLAEYVRQEVLDPLGIRDFYLGLPDSELPRWAPVVGDVGLSNPDPIEVRGLAFPEAIWPHGPVHNRPVVMRGVLPSAGAIVTAKAVARLFALLAQGGELDGVRLLSEERVRSFLVPRPLTIDVSNDIYMKVGMGGYWLGGEHGPPAPATDHSIAQTGAGGSIAWADLDRKLAVSICHNRMRNEFIELHDPFIAIGDALRELADARRPTAA